MRQPAISNLNRPEQLLRQMHESRAEGQRLKQKHDELMEEHEQLRHEFEKAINHEAATKSLSKLKMSSAPQTSARNSEFPGRNRPSKR